MRILAIDPFAGIAGDMFTGALLHLGQIDLEHFLQVLNSLELSGCRASVQQVSKNGIGACKFEVMTPEGVEGPGGEFVGKTKKFIPLTKIAAAANLVQNESEHEHRSLQQVLAIIKNSRLPEKVKLMACDIFTELGKAEAFIHNKTLDSVHFHEVGAADAIYDICAASLALNLLKIDKVVCRQVAVGGGTVKTAHGLLPVPTPATAKLLEGIETFTGPAEKELTTPTGAAILKTICNEFTSQISGKLLATGYGAGTMNFKNHPNVLKVSLLETVESNSFDCDEVIVMQCNIDDMNGEHLSPLIPQLLESGALDVTVIPCQMKKGRQGWQIELLCAEKERENLARQLLLNTTTFGVRWQKFYRLKLARKMVQIETIYGTIEAKAGYLDGVLIKISPEYENCKLLSKSLNVSLIDVYNAVHAAALPLLQKFAK